MRREERREMATLQLQDLLVISLPESHLGRPQSDLEGLQHFGPQLGGVFQRQRHGKTLQVHVRLDGFVVENIREPCCRQSLSANTDPTLDASKSAARDTARTHSLTHTYSLTRSFAHSLTRLLPLSLTRIYLYTLCEKIKYTCGVIRSFNYVVFW